MIDLLTLAREGKARLLLCTINLGEILYIIERRLGLVNALRSLALLESLPIEEILPDRSLLLNAACIKANHVLSYADAFVVALALRKEAVILTGDAEFQSVQGFIPIEWLAKIA